MLKDFYKVINDKKMNNYRENVKKHFKNRVSQRVATDKNISKSQLKKIKEGIQLKQYPEFGILNNNQTRKKYLVNIDSVLYIVVYDYFIRECVTIFEYNYPGQSKKV